MTPCSVSAKRILVLWCMYIVPLSLPEPNLPIPWLPNLGRWQRTKLSLPTAT
ncbi:hypothetical protein GQ607_012775 [Colletotrichum asianum]|uniref:Uncharacterized protein n=1 Tax=Colletotrichum asianum TaxID=702518 RepID=A0A8H3W661_9PEZI|nr:hypothetical protein GQ607_012775 [Colletotrichum asianum]